MLHNPGPAVDSENKPDPNRLQSVLSFDTHYGLKDRTGIPDPAVTQLEGAALKFALEDGNFPNPPSAQAKVDASAPPGDPQSTGAGVLWHVKGGSLKFRIASDFAISYASVAASKDNNDGVQVPDPKPKTTDDTGIYSRPMRVTASMQSELNVTVRLKSTGEAIGGWTKVQFDIKAVPVATFGKYSIDTDPSLSDASSLLSHQDGTTPLAMGVILSAPLPHLAESFIPVFKASDAAKLGVMDFRFVTPIENILSDLPDELKKKAIDQANLGMDWFVPRYEGPLQDSTKGIPVVVAPVQDKYVLAELSAQVLNMTSQQRWDGVGDTWRLLADSKASLVQDKDAGLLALCADALGWNQTPPSLASAPPTATPKTIVTPAVSATAAGSGGTALEGKPWELSGAFPAKTVRGTNKNGVVVKHLEETYLSLPQIAVV